MTDSVLRKRTRDFSKNVLLFCRKARKSGVEYEVTSQLLRAGTSIGANVKEAQYAQGKKDFASKLSIALKECNETEYWFELLNDVQSISEEDFKYFQKECIELRRMLVSSINTAKKALFNLNVMI